MFLHVGTSWRHPACTIRMRAEVAMFCYEAATSAPLQNALQSNFLYYSNFMATAIILEGCAATAAY